MKITKLHQPCPSCTSSDAYCEWEDGHGYCFSCHKTFPSEKWSGMNNQSYSHEYIPWRGITKKTMEFFDVKTLVDNNTSEPKTQIFPYPNGRMKFRELREKKFYTEGVPTKADGRLFGADKFPGGKYITLCEGEYDAMSVYQMLGSQYPSVSVGSASSAKKDVSADYEYVNSFERIYICFDNDEPGQRAAQEVAKLFDFNKVYLVSLSKYKDANDFLNNGEANLFVKSWWAARRFLPEGIISSYTEIDSIIDNDAEKPSVPYPYQQLEEMTYGIRLGEFNLFKAPEGIGKTEIFRSLEYHLLKTTDANIGIIHLEENKSRIIKGLVGYEIKTPVHLPDRAISKQELKELYRTVTKRDERVHIYNHFGSTNPDDILNAVRFLAGSCDCKYIFLDHITMVVTGIQGDDERRALDYISTRMAMMVEELDFTLFCISHVNDDGQTRGSRNIAKVANLVVNLSRDKMAQDPEVRNTTYLDIEKNRYSGRTGRCCELLFDPDSFTLSEKLMLP